jgi:hypothetical protein
VSLPDWTLAASLTSAKESIVTDHSLWIPGPALWQADQGEQCFEPQDSGLLVEVKPPRTLPGSFSQGTAVSNGTLS